MRWVALGVALAGCLHGKSHPCAGDDGASWVCPEDKACAAAPVYCGTADEVGACAGKMDRDPCTTTLVPDGQCLADQCTACSMDIAGCRYVGWNPMSSTSGETLHTVAFSGFGEAYAGGEVGTMLRYDVQSWLPDPRFPTATLASAAIVATVAAGQKIYALANISGAAVYVLDNNAWNPLPDVGQAYKSMWVFGNDVFLGGTGGKVAHYNGTAWAETTFGGGTTTYFAMWGTSATDVYAAGSTATTSTIAHYNGTAWTPVAAVANVGPLNAIWGVGTQIFAAGTGIVRATDGSTFTAMTAPTITGRGIWGSSETDVFVVGDGGTIVHWDGVAWVQMRVSFLSKLQAVSGSSAAEIFAVGDGGAIERYTGAGWATALAPTGASHLLGIWTAAPDEAFAVGQLGSSSIFHYKAGAWAIEQATPTISSALVGVWGRAANDVFAVGQLAAAHDTATWANISSPTIGEAVAVWGDATKVYAASSQVAAYDGTSWSMLTSGAGNFTGVWVAPSGRVWLSEANGVAHLEGSTVMPDVSQGHFNAVWGAGEADVFAAGVGTIQHGDATGFTAMTIPTSATMTALWGRGPDDVFAVGAGSTVLHLHAGIWKPLVPPFAADFVGVSGAGSSIFVAGADGSVNLLLDTAP